MNKLFHKGQEKKGEKMLGLVGGDWKLRCRDTNKYKKKLNDNDVVLLIVVVVMMMMNQWKRSWLLPSEVTEYNIEKRIKTPLKWKQKKKEKRSSWEWKIDEKIEAAMSEK